MNVSAQCTVSWSHSTPILNPGNLGVNVDFQAQTSGFTGLQSRTWYFGNSLISFLGFPTSSNYYFNASYNVCLFVNDANCNAYHCDTINISGIPEYTISGRVLDHDSTKHSFIGVVDIYRLNNSGRLLDPVYQKNVFPADSGAYFFDEITPGDYLINGKMHYSFSSPDVIPIYYGQSGYWKNAQIIKVDSSDLLDRDMFVLKEPSSMGGSISIVGTIKEGSFNRGPSDPMGGINIYMVNSGGDFVGYDVSDQDGSFEIDGVASGTYSIMPDMTGIEVDSGSMFNLTVNAQTDTLVLDVTVDSNSIHSNNVLVSIGQEVLEFDSYKCYPNPSRDGFTIELRNGFGHFYELYLYDAGGRLVGSLKGESERYIRFNRDILNPGLYLLEIRTLGQTYRKKLLLQ